MEIIDINFLSNKKTTILQGFINTMLNQLESLRQNTKIVADTGNIRDIQIFKPTDVTTNPSLILKVIRKNFFKSNFEKIIHDYKNKSYAEISDRLLVALSREIINIISGRVSIEIDARISFDTKAIIERARYLIHLCKESGISKDRILIKIASTWEGIQAARILEIEGIHCNLTLLFSLYQAIACADAKVQLISPFVGRIYDWYKKTAGSAWDESSNSGNNDPGVRIVSEIYYYYKYFDIPTEIMGASFRNVKQILALSGCDLLTISPEFLLELNQTIGTVPVKLTNNLYKKKIDHLSCNEIIFRKQINDDAMTTEKLAEGIRLFIEAAEKLESLISSQK